MTSILCKLKYLSCKYAKRRLNIFKEKTLKLELDKFEIIEENLDDDFALCKIFICSDGRNLHGIDISLEAIMKAKESLKNKYLVAQINEEGTDFMGHERTEYIVGHFPESSRMEMIQYKNRNFLVAQALISKVYATKDYFILSKGNHKGVSMEIKNIKWNDDWNTIEEFSFHGVTILGDSRTPAIPDANIEIMKFEEGNKHYNDYLNSGDKSEFLDNKNSTKKEVNMAKNKKFEDKVEEEDDNKTSMSEEEVEVNETDNKDVEENAKEEQCENKQEDKKEDKVYCKDLEQEFEILKNENATLKTKIASFEAEKYEGQVSSILFAITKKMPKFPKDKLEEFRKESKNYSLDNVKSYENYCKAQAFEVATENGIKVEKEGIERMARSQNIDFAKAVDNKPDPNMYG